VISDPKRTPWYATRERTCSIAKIATRGTCDAEYPTVPPMSTAIPVNM
jgi:hypothetical protein